MVVTMLTFFKHFLSYKGRISNLWFVFFVIIICPLVYFLCNLILQIILSEILPAHGYVVAAIVLAVNFPAFWMTSVVLIKRLRDAGLPIWFFATTWLACLPMLFIGHISEEYRYFTVQFGAGYFVIFCIVISAIKPRKPFSGEVLDKP